MPSLPEHMLTMFALLRSAVPRTLFWGSAYTAAAFALVAAAAEVAVAAAEAAAVRADAAAVLAAAAAEREKPPTKLAALLLKPWKVEAEVNLEGAATAGTTMRGLSVQERANTKMMHVPLVMHSLTKVPSTGM